VDKRIRNLIDHWGRRNIKGFYCADKGEVVKHILSAIPQKASVGISGSVTLDQIAVVKMLEARGNEVFNQYKSGISREESLRLRQQGVQAEYYLTSANAVAVTGEMVFFSAYGNRTAGIAYAKKLIVTLGTNKIVPTLQEALRRAREYVTPRNCQRLSWENTPCFKEGNCQEEICFSPEYRRMCCQIFIMEADMIPERVSVYIVDEVLGL
jgi:L-lactate utilization protein LutB